MQPFFVPVTGVIAAKSGQNEASYQVGQSYPVMVTASSSAFDTNVFVKLVVAGKEQVCTPHKTRAGLKFVPVMDVAGAIFLYQ